MHPLVAKRNADDTLSGMAQVRVFNRSAFFGKEILPCYGIGEVSTDPAYRGQGLARTCMDDALARIDAGPAKVSSLSAAAGVEKFYASFGYVAFPIRYTKMVFPLTPSPAAPLGASSAAAAPEANESPMARRIRMLAGSMSAAASSLSSAAASALGTASPAVPATPVAAASAPGGNGTTSQYQLQLNGSSLQIRKVDISAYAFELSMLYDAYNVGFVGPIARSHAYWRQFVPHKMKGGFWGAFEANPSACAEAGTEQPPFTTLVAYVGVAEKRGTVKVAEYAATKQWQGSAALFKTLTQIACVENPAVAALAAAGSDTGTPSVTAVVPMAPLTRLEGLTVEADEKLTDDSWMYRIRPGMEVAPAVASGGSGKRRPRGLQPGAVHEQVRQAAAANQHVMWFTDAF